MRAQCFYSIVETTGRQRMEQVKAMVAERGAMMKEQAEKLAKFELMDWTEEDVINASMNKVRLRRGQCPSSEGKTGVKGWDTDEAARLEGSCLLPLSFPSPPPPTPGQL
jgi:hypothetical protein